MAQVDLGTPLESRSDFTNINVDAVRSIHNEFISWYSLHVKSSGKCSYKNHLHEYLYSHALYDYICRFIFLLRIQCIFIPAMMSIALREQKILFLTLIPLPFIPFILSNRIIAQIAARFESSTDAYEIAKPYILLRKCWAYWLLCILIVANPAIYVSISSYLSGWNTMVVFTPGILYIIFIIFSSIIPCDRVNNLNKTDGRIDTRSYFLFFATGNQIPLCYMQLAFREEINGRKYIEIMRRIIFIGTDRDLPNLNIELYEKIETGNYSYSDEIS